MARSVKPVMRRAVQVSDTSNQKEDEMLQFFEDD